MRVSLNWVKRILGVTELGCTTTELLRRLTLHLAEIEGVETTGPELTGVVVGKVETCTPHPDADRLRCCTVAIGAEAPLPIVCGAPNVAAGQTVAVATIGCTLRLPGPDGTVQELTIKKGKLRGQPSHGMICAEDELGLGDSHDGILVLADDLPAGLPLAEALSGPGDTVLEVDNHNINHRPDLWGHLGWAREIAALCALPPPPAPDIAWTDDAQGWSVALKASEDCTCYSGAVMEGVRQAPAPEWMQQLLSAVGLRPRGLLVDLTNYVMLELGEPMHAFDRRQIEGQEIIVRHAQSGESFTTLDDRQHTLSADDLLIADSQRPLALAGIMGGQDTAVVDDTTTIVLEAATFRAGGIRQTRIRSGCASDSSSRFEKGLAPELTAAAINRACALLQELQPACRVVARFHAGSQHQPQRRIALDTALCGRLLGLTIPPETQAQHLRSLGCTVSGDTVDVPWWRYKDIAQSVDLVEEIGRLHGYDRIADEVPRLPAATPQHNRLRQAEHRLRRAASALGWDEVATYCFTSERWCTALAWPSERQIRLDHPLSQEQTVMRQELLPTLLDALAENRKHSDQVRIYEIGKIYGHQLGTAPCQDERLVLGGCCSALGADTPFYEARDLALALIADLGFTASLRVPEQAHPAALTGRDALLCRGPQVIGRVAELPAALRSTLKLTDAVAWFHLELEQLLTDQPVPAPRPFQTPSRYPAVAREFTFVCPEHLPWAELATCATEAAGSLGRAVELLTIYRGEQIDAGQKAVSFQVTLQADDHTLSEKELTRAQKKIIGTIEHRTPASLRG